MLFSHNEYSVCDLHRHPLYIMNVHQVRKRVDKTPLKIMRYVKVICYVSSTRGITYKDMNSKWI